VRVDPRREWIHDEKRCHRRMMAMAARPGTA
jgi:hypothetical protein